MPELSTQATGLEVATDAGDSWRDERLRIALALEAVALLRADPQGLKGVLCIGPDGPLRDALRAQLNTGLGLVDIPPSLAPQQLHGGLDIAATLATGKTVHNVGLWQRHAGHAFALTSSGTIPQALLQQLAKAIEHSADEGTDAPALVVFDDHRDDESGIASSPLGERLCAHIELPSVPLSVLQTCLDAHAAYLDADTTSTRLSSDAIGQVALPEAVLRDLCTLAVQLGITSMHAMTACVRIARVNAARHGRNRIIEADITLAVQLALAPRRALAPVTMQPNTEQEPSDPSTEGERDSPPQQTIENSGATGDAPLAHDQTHDNDEGGDNTRLERLIEAATAAIPAGLLDEPVAMSTRPSLHGQRSAAAGRDRKASVHSNTRGRPVGVQRPRARSELGRINLLETLKAAVPWQTARRAESPSSNRPESHRAIETRWADIRCTRFRQSPRTTTVFVVDASGSAALHRLAEAKGAVQVILGECYVRRDRVALITFNHDTARLVLPPTRSLTRANRQLQGLPGGGSTPLATAFQCAHQLMRQLQREGELPVGVFMTDGRANIALDGTASRHQAIADAEVQAKRLALLNTRLLFIDTSPRPRRPAQALAEHMQARYTPLPRVGIDALPALVSGAA